MLSHILVPLDTSELSERALEVAKQIVAPDGRITLLSVVEPPIAPYIVSSAVYPVPFDYEQLHEEQRKHAREYLERLLKRVRETAPLSDFSVRIGSPAEVILEVAKDVQPDAIVMSTHGRSGLGRWIFGSVTQKVLSATPCPVMVIPAR